MEERVSERECERVSKWVSVLASNEVNQEASKLLQ